MSGSAMAAVARFDALPSVLPRAFTRGDTVDIFIDFFAPGTRAPIDASSVTAQVWNGAGALVSPALAPVRLGVGLWQLQVPLTDAGPWRAVITASAPGTAVARADWTSVAPEPPVPAAAPLAATIVSVRSFGAVCDGVADDAPAIAAAIAAVKAAGGGTVMLPGGVIAHAAPIVLEDASGVALEGVGQRRTELRYTGAATDFAVALRSSQTAAAKMVSGALRNMRLNGNGLANRTLACRSIDYCEFADLELRGGVQWQWDWDCHEGRIRPAGQATGGDPADNQNNESRRIKFLCTGTQAGIRLGGNSSGVAGVGANTSLNYFENVFCDIRDGDGFVFGYSDANTLTHYRVFRPQANTGRGIVFLAGAAADGRHARHNVVVHAQTARGGVWALAGDGTQPSEENHIVGYSLGNLGVDFPPVIEAGASLTYISPETFYRMGAHQVLVVGGTSQVTAVARTQEQRALLTDESLRVWNPNGNHMILTNSVGGVGTSWSIYINPVNNDLEIFRSEGAAGRVNIVSGQFRCQSVNIGNPTVQVVGGRRTGWVEPIGAVDRSAFDVATVTTGQLAQRVNALIRDLTAHGLIGT